MSARLGLTMERLRGLHVGACDSDARVLMKKDDETNLSIKTQSGTFNLSISGTRELRLLAKQLEWFANYLDRKNGPPDIEEIA